MKCITLSLACAIIAGWTPRGVADAAATATDTVGAPAHKSARLVAQPELESATATAAIIRWTTTNPGGTALHFGVVHYGTDADNLSELAQSPDRRNLSHSDMIFRVRITGLTSNTTYYYKVSSTGATGASDGVSSSVRSFKTR